MSLWPVLPGSLSGWFSRDVIGERPQRLTHHIEGVWTGVDRSTMSTMSTATPERKRRPVPGVTARGVDRRGAFGPASALRPFTDAVWPPTDVLDLRHSGRGPVALLRHAVSKHIAWLR
jgi:hypothetical protein